MRSLNLTSLKLLDCKKVHKSLLQWYIVGRINFFVTVYTRDQTKSGYLGHVFVLVKWVPSTLQNIWPIFCIGSRVLIMVSSPDRQLKSISGFSKGLAVQLVFIQCSLPYHFYKILLLFSDHTLG